MNFCICKYLERIIETKDQIDIVNIDNERVFLWAILKLKGCNQIKRREIIVTQSKLFKRKRRKDFTLN